MPELLIVSGPPGAGKSSVAAALVERWEPSVLVEGDVFFQFLRRGAIAPWLVEANAQNTVVTLAAGAATGRFAAAGMVTVYDGLIGPWFLPEFTRAAGIGSFDYAVLMPSLEVCLERVSTRIGQGFTDLDAARHMYDQFVTRSDTVEPRHFIRDPPHDVATAAELLAELVQAGSLRYDAGRE